MLFNLADLVCIGTVINGAGLNFKFVDKSRKM